jgi:sodium transport system permease protein
VSTLWALLRLELRLQLRQPFTLLLLVVLPTLVGPGALWGAQRTTEAADAARDGSSDPSEPVAIAADDTFAAWLIDDDGLQVRDESEGVAATVTVDPDERAVVLHTDPRTTEGRQARQRVQAAMRRHNRAQRDEAIARAGLDPDTFLWTVERIDVRGATTPGGRSLGRMLPGLLLFALLLGTVYTAFDVVTGDKERRTAATLLSTGAPRSSIVAAKAAVIVAAAFLSGTSLVASLVVTHRIGLFAGTDLQLALSALTPAAVLAAEGLVLLLGLQVAGAALGVSAWVDDYRSGSMVAGPVLLATMLPSALPLVDGLDLRWWVVFVPVGNVAMAFRELLAGQLQPVAAVAVFVVALAQSLGAFALGLRLLQRESTFTGTADPDARRALGRFGPDAALTFVSVMLTFWFLGTLAQRVHLVGGLVLSQAMFVGFAFGAMGFFGAPLRRMRLSPPRPTDLLLGVGIGLCTPFPATVLFTLQEHLFPGTLQFAQTFSEAMAPLHDSLFMGLLLVALLPGLCEELLFRGTLLGLLDKSLPPAPRVVVVALLFGAMHLSVVRMLPTTLVGLAAGAVALRSGSVWVAVALHVTHNAVSVSLLHLADPADSPELSPSAWALAGVATLIGLGCVRLVGRGGRE